MSLTYTISELAKEFSVTTRTIRFYEDQGLLSPRREGTSRIFSARDRVRLKLALRGKRLGFSLAAGIPGQARAQARAPGAAAGRYRSDVERDQLFRRTVSPAAEGATCRGRNPE
jgi:hypothetical protein